MDSAARGDAIRRSYDAVAEKYLVQFGHELEYKPLDRALLRMMAEGRDRSGPVADLGCGPGHVAAWLAALGAPAVGIDLSPAMVEAGRRTYPAVEFRQGDLLALPASEGEFGALVALYCIIHLDPDELVPAFAEMRRVLCPGGLALVSFHVGSEVRHLSDWFGHRVDVDFRFFESDAVLSAMEAAGLTVQARLERARYPQESDTRRGYLLASRPSS